MLDRVQPKPALVRAFRAMVSRVWGETQREAREEQKRLTWRLRGLQQKKDRLVEAHVHDQTIDAKTFRDHMDRLRQEEAMAKLERYDAEIEELDVGAVLAFAERTLCDLRGSWNCASTPQKQRLHCSTSVAVIRNVCRNQKRPTFRIMPEEATKTDALLRLARKGPVRARDLDEAGIPRAYLRRLCDRGIFERVDRGIYRLADAPVTELQRVLFPDGITWDGERCSNSTLSSVFAWIDPISETGSRLVTPTRLSWNQLSAFIETWGDLRRAA